MKKLKNRGEVPKNIYSKVCKNPLCAIPFECNHANRGFVPKDAKEIMSEIRKQLPGRN